MSNAQFAEVAVPLHVFQTFTYRLSPEQSTDAEVGSRLVVPLGRNLVTSYIVSLLDELPATLSDLDIKDAQVLIDSEPVCNPEILQLARWVADYYACPLGEVIKAALPPGMTPKTRSGSKFVKPKLRRFVRLLANGAETKLTDTQQRVLSALETSGGPMSLQALLTTANVSASTITSLEKKSLLEIYDDAVRRDPLAETFGVSDAAHTL
ncbi:MAG TPA: hypothetical protein VK868_14350, partial [Pyrinomonadaceae bacterium]|nr:hypothetical protein [Pyrinomonadaceae bacterium]